MDFPEARRVFLPGQEWLQGSLFPGPKEGSGFCLRDGFDYAGLVSFIGFIHWCDRPKRVGGGDHLPKSEMRR